MGKKRGQLGDEPTRKEVVFSSSSGNTYSDITKSTGSMEMAIAAVQDSNPVELDSEEGLVAEMHILGLVLMPEEFGATLYADQFSTEDLSKRSITQRQPISWVNQITTVTGLQYLLPTETFVVSRRGVGSVWCRGWFYSTNGNASGSPSPMYYTLADTNGPRSDYFLQPQANTAFFDYNIGDCTSAAGTPGIGGQPPGSPYAESLYTTTMVCGVTHHLPGFENARWFLLAATNNPQVGYESKITVTWNFTIVANCIVFVYRCNGLSPVFVASRAFTAGTVAASYDFVLEGPLACLDFYCLKYYEVPNANGVSANFPVTVPPSPNGFAFQPKSSCGTLGQMQVQSAFKNIMQLGPMTTIAASLRFTDMAAPLNIQGEMAIATLRESMAWWLYFNAAQGGGGGSPFKLVSTYKDAYCEPLRLGGYAWHGPFRATQFELDPCCTLDIQNNIIKDIWWDLEDDSVQNVFAANSTNSGNNQNGTGLGCDAWLTLVTCLNWMTDNDWTDCCKAPYAFNIWQTALDRLRFAPRTMSNHYHIGTLMKWLVDKGRVAKKYVGPLFRAAGPIARKVAEHFIGKPLTDEGVKLLKDAYQIGDAIATKLQQ